MKWTGFIAIRMLLAVILIHVPSSSFVQWGNCEWLNSKSEWLTKIASYPVMNKVAVQFFWKTISWSSLWKWSPCLQLLFLDGYREHGGNSATDLAVFQSRFWTGHVLVNDLIWYLMRGIASLLAITDLSTTFDTISYSIYWTTHWDCELEAMFCSGPTVIYES